MIVCQCKGTTDRQIRKAMMRGARSCEQVGRECEAGTACGGCIPTIECLVRPDHARVKTSRRTSAA